MTFTNRIKLMLVFYKSIAVWNMAITVFIIGGAKSSIIEASFSTALIATFWSKLFISFVTYGLLTMTRDNLFYFYFNLGISKIQLFSFSFILDLAASILLLKIFI